MKKGMITAIFTAAASIFGITASGAPSVCASEADVLSQDTLSFYEYWKDKYIVKNPYVQNETQYYVYYSEEKYSGGGPVAVTVSEAHGYGMLIAACMSEYDSEAKEIFDGMYRFYKDHTSEIGKNLMAWQQADNGTAIVNVSGADSATDGDMDIAYALLMADFIWGSGGEINYRETAIDVIDDIMTYEVNKTDWIMQLGDWAYWSDEGDEYFAATRASDFIVQYMPVFARASGDSRWLSVYDSTYAIIGSFLDEYGTGILPDFIVKDKSTGKFVPAPENFLESENDGNYYYNSCRTPWRISMDYLVGGNEEALKFAKAINEFIIKDTGGDPWEIKAGYTPEGEAVETYNDLCFTAPFLVSAACGDDEAWKNEMRDTVINYGDDIYYGDTIKMLCLISADGGWIVPEKSDAVRGDVNSDGEFSLADAVMFLKYLASEGTLTDRTAGDLNSDGLVNIYDMLVMKKLLLNGK